MSKIQSGDRVVVTKENLLSTGKAGEVVERYSNQVIVLLDDVNKTYTFNEDSLTKESKVKKETVAPQSLYTNKDITEGDTVMRDSGSEGVISRKYSANGVDYLSVMINSRGTRFKQVWRTEFVTEVIKGIKVLIPNNENPDGMYILWSPESVKPPKVKHYTYGEAKKAQEYMASKYPDQTFCIMKAVSSLRMQKKLEVKWEREEVNY